MNGLLGSASAARMYVGGGIFIEPAIQERLMNTIDCGVRLGREIIGPDAINEEKLQDAGKWGGHANNHGVNCRSGWVPDYVT